MSELTVPTVPIAAEVLSSDGRTLRGRVFMPAFSSRHSGPMRAGEWLNDPPQFFAFQPEEGRSLLLNKKQVVVMRVSADQDSVEDEGLTHRRVIVECGGERRVEGTVRIEMPEHHSRLLDYVNGPDAFLTLCDGPQRYLVQKEHITRVAEIREE